MRSSPDLGEKDPQFGCSFGLKALQRVHLRWQGVQLRPRPRAARRLSFAALSCHPRAERDLCLAALCVSKTAALDVAATWATVSPAADKYRTVSRMEQPGLFETMYGCVAAADRRRPTMRDHLSRTRRARTSRADFRSVPAMDRKDFQRNRLERPTVNHHATSGGKREHLYNFGASILSAGEPFPRGRQTTHW
jgi:hypothetical protein